MFLLCVELRVSKTRNREGLSWTVLFFGSNATKYTLAMELIPSTCGPAGCHWV